jgi:hypothetical protein
VHQPWSAFWQLLAELGTQRGIRFVVVDLCRGDDYRIRRRHESIPLAGLPVADYIAADQEDADARMHGAKIDAAVIAWFEDRIHYWRESLLWPRLMSWLDAQGWPTLVLDYAGASKWHPEAAKLCPTLVLRPFNLARGCGARFVRIRAAPPRTAGHHFNRSVHGGRWRIFVGPPQVENDTLAHLANLALFEKLARCGRWIDKLILLDIDPRQVRAACCRVTCPVHVLPRTLPWTRLAREMSRVDLFVTTNPQTFLSRRAMVHGSLVLFLRPPAGAFWWDRSEPMPATAAAIAPHLSAPSLAELERHLASGGDGRIDHTLLSGQWWSLLAEEPVLRFWEPLSGDAGEDPLYEILRRSAGFDRFLDHAETQVAERLFETPSLRDHCFEMLGC